MEKRGVFSLGTMPIREPAPCLSNFPFFPLSFFYSHFIPLESYRRWTTLSSACVWGVGIGMVGAVWSVGVLRPRSYYSPNSGELRNARSLVNCVCP